MKPREKTGELIALQNKIEEQDDAIEKLKQQENKLNNYIKEFKDVIKKKKSPQKIEDRKKISDTSKMTSQLNKEIDIAKIRLKNYQHELKNVKKNTTKLGTSDLSDLNVSLRKKETQLRKLQQQIKQLGFAKRKQQKQIAKKQKDQDGQKLSILMDDLRKNKQLLQKLRKKQNNKKQGLIKKKQTIKQLQRQCQQKLKNKGQQALTYEQFKSKKKDKKRQEISTSQVKKQNGKKIQLSVRQIINSQQAEKVEYNERYLKEIKIKREVAQHSLKIMQKKYQKEEDELNKKLQILKIQNKDLNTRLIEKRKQMQLRQNYDGKNSSTTNRKLTPIV